MKDKDFTLFAMSNSEKLGSKIAKQLKKKLTKIDKTEFADGELLLKSMETVRNKNVYVIASTCPPVNNNIMELLLFIDSLKRASARSINVIMTYYGYARQDRKVSGRQPIGAKLVADILEKTGVSKMITVDLHNASIQGFFSIPLDDLRGQFIFAKNIKELGKFTIVSPDHGGAARARVLAELVADTVQIAIVDKRRIAKNKTETMGILGNVRNKNAIIIDDMIDTGGTIIKAAEALKEKGAKKIFVLATHGIFSKGFDGFEKSKVIDEVWISDSIENVYNITSKKLKVFSLDVIISQVIDASVKSKSISQIYTDLKSKI